MAPAQTGGILVKPKLRVLLVQLPVPNNPGLNTPLAAGYLKAFAYAQGLGSRFEIELLPRALADHAGDALLEDAIAAREPDIVGVSLYTWNSERSLGIIERVKRRLPSVRVVVGGPEVQNDNRWVLEHPAVDVAVIGEGEQTFAELLRHWGGDGGPFIPLVGAAESPLAAIPGIAYRWHGATHFTAERAALSDLAAIPSPYLAGYLGLPRDGTLMIEISRWCPYACSFCLYGRNMGPRLGSRYFGLERVLAEIAWGREQGIRRVHFVEANLNLVPLFWPLMRALAELNRDRQMTFYAELRGEHLTDEVVAALDRANVRYVEVGLQTANLAALKASHRRTDLQKWAAGTRRLYEHGIEVYLDVILGLPADDAAGVAETLDFIRREALGTYDIFTLQVLPGTAVRQASAEYGLRFQDRPPYYVLATSTFGFGDLRRLRRQLKHGANLPPDAVEGMPEPRHDALVRRQEPAADSPTSQIWLCPPAPHGGQLIHRLAAHVDVVLRAADRAAHTPLLAAAIVANPFSVFDVYIHYDAETPLDAPEQLRQWRAALPFQASYLDRVAVYSGGDAAAAYARVSPRLWLVLPWSAQAEPAAYASVAEIIWQYTLAEGEEPPLGAWAAAGGAGVWLPGGTALDRASWGSLGGVPIWG